MSRRCRSVRSCLVPALALAAMLLFAPPPSASADGPRHAVYAPEREPVAVRPVMQAVGNLYDEGFRPVPGRKNVYVLPGTNVMVKCSDRFTLNLSMKRTFPCHHIDQYGNKIPNSDFVVEINPMRGEDGFSPYTPPEGERRAW